MNKFFDLPWIPQLKVARVPTLTMGALAGSCAVAVRGGLGKLAMLFECDLQRAQEHVTKPTAFHKTVLSPFLCEIIISQLFKE